MTRLSAGDKRIKFANPPINEVAIALFHLPLGELKAQHIGLYWNRIRNRYPRCDQQTVIISPQDQQPPEIFKDVPGEIFPLPRFWFFSDVHPTLIQIQRNAFLFNWRRGDGKVEYPHYETVADGFWKELDRYNTFLQDVIGEKLDVIQRCELNYVNLIDPNEFFAGPSEIGNVLPLFGGLHQVETEDQRLVGMNTTVTYQINRMLFIDLITRLGVRSDTKQPVIYLEMKAHGVPDDLSLEGGRSWYDAAHNAIYRMFLEITDKQIQEEVWEPR